MTTWSLVMLLACVVFVSWGLVGLLIGFLHKHQIVDTPNERTLHIGSVPRGGGLVVVGLLLITLLALAFLSDRYWVFSGFSVVILAWSSLGWWDDQRDLSARKRLVFQLLITLFMVLGFGYVNSIELSADRIIDLGAFGAIATFVGVIWLANLYNFMDGMDGLAATQAIIASISLGFWFWQAGDPHLALACLILASACYGFILWNWRPARIFMGDVGSITIGGFFALLIIFGNTRYQIPVVSFVLLLGVFVFDASYTILRRILKRRKIWMAHREHYYQRLANIGISHRRIVNVEAVLMLICSMIASITVLDHDRIAFAVCVELAILIIAAAWVVYLEKNQAESHEHD